MSTSIHVCANCGNPVGGWWRGDTIYWKHQTGWRSPPT